MSTLTYLLLLEIFTISISYVSSFVTIDKKYLVLLDNRLKSPDEVSVDPRLPVIHKQHLFSETEDDTKIDDKDHRIKPLRGENLPNIKLDKEMDLKKIMNREITTLETSLRIKRCRLSKLLSFIDQYSESGFSRKVAELDSLRKNLNIIHQSQLNDSMALVIKPFLPILDRLFALNKLYHKEKNDFAINGYGALATDMKNCLHGLGLEKSNVQIGYPVNRDQMKIVGVVESEYSSDLNLNGSEIVMEVKQDGYTYKDIVLRLANVTVKRYLDSETIMMDISKNKDKPLENKIQN